MAVYGWAVWKRGGQDEDVLPVRIWAPRVHATAVAAIIILAAISGSILDTYTDAAYPYIDSLTTFAAIWATFLVARKVFENWWYWLLIDAVSIVIYWTRELELTALLFVGYVILIPIGMKQWLRSYRAQSATPQ
jgi:nicotinamide mononucleotide transporter